jgi:L-ascorbate metabolism protein UlaG (beta-lactamase superfamily)
MAALGTLAARRRRRRQPPHTRLWPLFLAAASACGGPAYRGPVSAHFDGARFFDDPRVRQISGGDLVHWSVTADAIEWPEWDGWKAGAGPSRPPARVDGDEVRVTFVNHSTMLVQMGGLNVLTDPVWSNRVGPASWLGPRRHHDPGVRLEDLPHIDAVLVSHDHYDHMDLPTLQRLAARDAPLVVAGLGNGRLLDAAGVTPHEELDWWACRPLGQGRVCALPAQHNSRRGLFDGNRTLWVSFWIETPAGSVYFGGDTGFGPHFARIRERMGPPCVALLPIGAYKPRWIMAGNHMDPADAVRAHDVLGARASVAMHFATFSQSDEGMYQPAGELGLALAEADHNPFVVPGFGAEHVFHCGEGRPTAGR